MSEVTLDRSQSGFFEDPLKEWTNDDLLLTEDRRAEVKKRFPDIYGLLDWPELRERFVQFDQNANALRDDSRIRGVESVFLGVLALVAAAVAQETSGWFKHFLLVLTVGSTIATFWFTLPPIIFGRNKKTLWLKERLKAERLRQLYFQFIIANLETAIKAVADEAARSEWDSRRVEAMAAFEERYIKNEEVAFVEHRDDEADLEVWHHLNWAMEEEIAVDESSARRWVNLLIVQRLNIQRLYTARKLNFNWNSIEFKHRIVSVSADILTFILPVFASVTAFSALFTQDGSLPTTVLSISTATIAAIVVGLRTLSDGLQLPAEAERYKWYRSQILSIEQNLRTSPDWREQVAQMRRFEIVAYHELRRFIADQSRARFLPSAA